MNLSELKNNKGVLLCGFGVLAKPKFGFGFWGFRPFAKSKSKGVYLAAFIINFDIARSNGLPPPFFGG